MGWFFILQLSDIVRPVEWMKSFTGDGLPPGPNEDFYTGVKSSIDWYNGRVGGLMDAYRDFGPVFTGRSMGLKVVWLIGAKANQMMYVDDWQDFFWWGESLHGHLAGLIGEGLLSSVDETHDKARKLLDPVFSKENLTKYVDTMIEETENEVAKLGHGDQFDFYEWIYDLALINATSCFMGMDTDTVDMESLHENFDTCVKYYQNSFYVQALRGPGTPHWSFQRAKSKIDEVLYDEIERRRGTSGIGDNILDRLIEAEEEGDEFTDEEIHDQIMTLYWAGHDTTISAISWLIMLVGKYPGVYDKLRREIDERVGDEPVEPEEIMDGLPYLEMVMDETLRLYPPAWIAFRKSRKEFEIYGHTIPEGTELGFSSYVTHRLPHLFDDPEAFDPERMKPERQREFPPGAYIPFARGPRTCIGMNFAKYEIKLVVATLLRHFDFELVPGQEFRSYPIATLTPDSVRVTLSRRNRNRRANVGDTSGSEDAESPKKEPFSVESSTDGSETGDCPFH